MLLPANQLGNQKFDHVIVGGGTAGLTLAARLTEDPSVRVLVLEAGQANIDDPELLRPAIYGSHFANPVHAWPHKTVGQKGLNGREAPWPRGKGLGGSSAINFMCYTKPPARDVDDFERLGNPGWNWTKLQPYFERVEGFVEPTDEYRARTGVQPEHWNIGRHGPLMVSYPKTLADGELLIQQSFLNCGLPRSPKPLDGDPRGITFLPNTYDPRTHKRSYSTTAFYLPNRHRPNLRVVVGARANRVLTERGPDGQWVAAGVEFTDEASGSVFAVNAKREVILCAGALQSPQILELSGFGRPDILAKIGVPLKEELPGVGENVQEHMYVGVSWELKDDAPFDTLDLLRDPAVAAQHLELHARGEGLHTTGIVGFAWAAPADVAGPSALASIKAQMQAAVDAVDAKAHPALKTQIALALARLETSPGCEYISVPGFLGGPNPPVPGKRYATICVALNHCISRGAIHCASADPLQPPAMDAGYYEQDVDLAVHVEAVKFARRVAATAPMRDMLQLEHSPGADVQTDEQLRDWIKSAVCSTWHTAGSCSMLPKEMHGVVAPDLKVYGTGNLRVVDLSVVPLHFASHPMSVVYAIAEKAADLIKDSAA